jgi:DNA primase
LAELRAGATTLLVESPLDVLVAHGWGFPAVAAFGTAVSNARLQLIKSKTDRLVVALDADVAGQLATHRLLCDSKVSFSKMWVLNYARCPGAKDVGEMDNRDQLELAIETAVPADRWLVSNGAGRV